MSADLGSITFDEVRGRVIPRTVPVIEDVDNPALVDADVSLDVGQRSRLVYRGWFTTSQAAALFALVDTTVSADDETGATHTVRVCSVDPEEVKALCAGTVGRWVVATVEVKPWA